MTREQQELVLQWRHLPRAVAKKLTAKHGHNCLRRDRLWCSFRDLVKQGYLGLLKASLHYQADQGASFSTYAWTCIHNEMCDLLKADNRHKRPLAILQGLEPRPERLIRRHKDLLPEVALKP